MLLFGSVRALSQQIPNAGFENWNRTNLNGWETSNTSDYSSVSPSVNKTKNAYTGNYAIELINRKSNSNGVMIGMAVTGHLDAGNNYSVSGGFPFNEKPGRLTGFYQNMAGFGSDTASISVYLFKFDTIEAKRDTIAFGELVIGDMHMSYVPFSILLTYSCNHAPDSALIILLTSKYPQNAVDKSYLIVDDLAFADTTALIDTDAGFTDAEFAILRVKVSPFLAKHEISVSFQEDLRQKYQFILIDSFGREVFKNILTEKFTKFSTMSFRNGNYTYRIIGEDKMRIGVGRIIISH